MITKLNNKWLALAQLSGCHAAETNMVKFDSLLSLLDLTGDIRLSPNPSILGQDSSGHIWCGMNEGGMAYRFDSEKWLGYYVPGAGTQ